MASYAESEDSTLESVNQFLGAPLLWQPITSTGTSNRLFCAQHKEEKLILRVNASSKLAFGVSRESEAKILALIQGYHWAPKVIKNNWQQGWCLMQDHGATVTEGACQSILPILLDSVDQWQRIAAVERGQFDYQALFDAYRVSIQQSAESTNQTDDLLMLDHLIQAFDTLPEVPCCLTHHDLHIGNLCGDKKQLTVLDWEYAGFGNPWFDAACLHAKFKLPISSVGALPAFQHLSEPALMQGMTNAIGLIKVLETLWFNVRANHSPRPQITISSHTPKQQ